MAILLLGLEDQFWRPDPFPGSEKAEDQGCICPIEQPWPGQLAIDEDCPVHKPKWVSH